MCAVKSQKGLEKISKETGRTMRLWLMGKREDMPIYRIPKSNLYFNIENGRYADKMLQIRADNPGIDIDPRLDKWKNEIFDMLKGEYKHIDSTGTEQDKAAFERLKEDILKRQQLNPGIVLADGGVIDGNRRLAVLMALTGPNFDYFEGVILPEDIPAQDRWRIEVGIQMGKDQQLDYSPINKLLKIRQGLEIFNNLKIPPGKTPEDMVAESLYGVEKKEIDQSIKQLGLIDEYLAFFNMPGQYHEVGDRSERFIETLNTLMAAHEQKNQSPSEISKLKSSLFVAIREELLSNWEIRQFRQALGGRLKSRGKKGKAVDKAIRHFVEHSTDPKAIREAYVKGTSTKIKEKTETLCREFKDIYEAEKDKDKPLSLAKDVRTKLETLKNALKNFRKFEDIPAINAELNSIKKLVRACHSSLGTVKKKK